MARSGLKPALCSAATPEDGSPVVHREGLPPPSEAKSTTTVTCEPASQEAAWAGRAGPATTAPAASVTAAAVANLPHVTVLPRAARGGAAGPPL